MSAKKILLIEDEKDISDLIAFHLRKEGYTVEQVFDGDEAWKRLKFPPPDLIILDLMLPGMNGLELTRLIKGRKDTQHIPIIMVTAKGEEVDKVIGLEMGADDYITKPFSARELVARVRAVLRRLRYEDSKEKNVFKDGELFIDYDLCEVRIGERTVELGPMEMRLLFFLTQHPNRVYNRDKLLDAVWGDETFVEPRTVDVHISRLRRAIEANKEDPCRIVTVRGMGYKYVLEKPP